MKLFFIVLTLLFSFYSESVFACSLRGNGMGHECYYSKTLEVRIYTSDFYLKRYVGQGIGDLCDGTYSSINNCSNPFKLSIGRSNENYKQSVPIAPYLSGLLVFIGLICTFFISKRIRKNNDGPKSVTVE